MTTRDDEDFPAGTASPDDDEMQPVPGHAEWTDQFSDYLDDELTASERQLVEHHLRECPPCAGVMNELRQVIGTAGSLTHLPPGEQVWQAVAAEIREMPRLAAPSTGRRFSFTLPQLAAASVLLALLSGWAALRLVTSPSTDRAADAGTVATPSATEPVAVSNVEGDDPLYNAAVSDLEQALERGRGRLDPETVATVQSDLRVIDMALEEARRALVNDPANTYLSGHIVDTRQRKLDLLRRAAALTTDSQM
jgi:hypothetical protein